MMRHPNPLIALLVAAALLAVGGVAVGQSESAETSAVESAAPESSLGPDTSAAPLDETVGPRVIELEADATLRFLQDGEPIMEIAVTPGETVVFRIDNTAAFAHNFYIGADEELNVPNGTTDIGLSDWESGVQELEWVVPEDLTGLRFACTVPGHYFLMQGDFTVAP